MVQAAKALTPFLTQYLEIKGRYKDALLFFRMGDFYELFFDDAKVASSVLEIALTARNKNDADPIPMCGMPHHSAKAYINKLVSRGHKVAICEQLEDPATAKGIVKRDVVQVVSPGTQFDPDALESKSFNFTHAAVSAPNGSYSFASCDFSTGLFLFGVLPSLDAWLEHIKVNAVAEVIVPDGDEGARMAQELEGLTFVQRVAEHYFDPAYATARIAEQFETQSLSAVHKRLCDAPHLCAAVGALIKYFQETQKWAAADVPRIPLVTQLMYWTDGFSMDLDAATLSALDLVPERGRLYDSRPTVFQLLDRTKTAMGGRSLKSWLARPLTNERAINTRLDDVQWFFAHLGVTTALQSHLAQVYDIERLVVRATLGTANSRELKNLATSVLALQEASSLLIEHAAHSQSAALSQALTSDVVNLCSRASQWIVETPPLTLREGGLFNRGVDARLDELMELTTNGTQWLADFEAQERTTTGIGSLKVRFNRVFGYYIEITKSNIAAVPLHYVRKQTTAVGERCITAELKEFEDRILNAESRRFRLEAEMFQELRQEFAKLQKMLGACAKAAASLDALSALAVVAHEKGFVRPTVDATVEIDIVDGRHPLVESRGGFVPNSLRLDNRRGHFMFITGPNMGGKSTIMRQTALIALMAQSGSFVPATAARIGVCDRVFTRIGASDNIAAGQSTFMVEMSEMSFILRNASERSLVLLDEVGRGTSTFDGLSLAWALAEELLTVTGARTLFATHYHELTELAAHHPQVINMQVAVECGDDRGDPAGCVRFLYKLIPGAAQRSYGIAVAKLAGLPPRVIKRAETILARLETQKATRAARNTTGVGTARADQLGLGL